MDTMQERQKCQSQDQEPFSNVIEMVEETNYNNLGETVWTPGGKPKEEYMPSGEIFYF